MDLHNDDGDLAALVASLMGMGYVESEAFRLAQDILDQESSEYDYY